jgi:hypothetical protein
MSGRRVSALGLMGGIPQANNPELGRNHGMQADGLRPTGTLAWLVHDTLQALAVGPPDGRADTELRDEG